MQQAAKNDMKIQILRGHFTELSSRLDHDLRHARSALINQQAAARKALAQLSRGKGSKLVHHSKPVDTRR